MAAPDAPHHVTIYGPPAAGKLTVATALAERTGLRLLDNHVSVDAALRLFEFGTPEFNALVERIRVEMLSAASMAGLGVVSTLVFADPGDRGHIANLAAASARGGAIVTYVRLAPARSVLAERVVASSRSSRRKIRDLALLDELMARHQLTNAINDDDLTIDNTDLPPGAVADLIAAHVGLPVTSDAEAVS